MTITNQSRTTLTVDETALWYIKTGLDRALRMTRENIEKTEKRLEKLRNSERSDDEFTKEFIAEAEAIREYYQQWYREAKAEFKNLPYDIRPIAATD